MSTNHSYTMQVSAPAIFIELYLPKKASLQGTLFRTLTNGFKLEEVKRHFRAMRLAQDPSMVERVRALAIPAGTILSEELTDEGIEHFPRVFFGYSMYEVDGVFNQEVLHEPADPDSNYMLAEERTQIIRLIFKYPGEDLAVETLDVLRAAMKDPWAGPAAFRKQSDGAWQARYPHASQAIRSLKQWVNYVGWFLFGYLLYQICEEITRQYLLELKEAEDTGSDSVRKSVVATVRQEEIWIGSLSNLNVNVLQWSL